MSRPSDRNFEQRLADGVMVGAEGYVFELERRGYIKAGPYVPEVILDDPDALRQLHREFLRAGSDVMVALTYYAHREKLKAVGRDGDLEALNRQVYQELFLTPDYDAWLGLVPEDTYTALEKDGCACDKGAPPMRQPAGR